jgi:multicomponent Na+:H+ antiporter subunit D
VPALSLAGLPPFSGFVGKYALVKAGLEGGAYITVFISLAVSILTLYSMTKIWNEAFWKTAPRDVDGHVPERQLSRVQTWGILVPGMALATFSVALSIAAAPVLAVSTAAATQLLDPQVYISAVLGAPP